ncbi:MAG: bifunctional acetate--CoA ligase family protein/GNAT family N-acetyltransferase [Xanthomonadales bacterium]|nr:bifunctional acetate--CoA ligase family protein/GNAT family N-acetyltransferase [Xanthomonadales bacterium]
MNPIETLFSPSSIAVFGASERSSVGGLVYRNLLDGGFDGEVIPINPGHESIHGTPCFSTLEESGKRVDLAIIATPARTVSGIFEQLKEAGVHAATVLSAGFSETGSRGASLEDDLRYAASTHGIRFLGPNCLGFMRPGISLNATFSRNHAKPGGLALLSQSGAIATAILDWAEPRGIGFSAVVSVGDAADIGFGDLLDHLALDEETTAILVYVEGVRNARSFVTGLRAAARLKPVIVIKAGRQAAGSRAAVSHTGAIVGEDDVFESVLHRAGAVRVSSIDELFAAARILATGLRSSGNRLAIVTNAGGAGVMAADRAADLKVELPAPSTATLEALDAQLPPNWSRGNPLDVLGDADPDRFAVAVQACLGDPAYDGVLVMLAPVATADPDRVAERVLETIPEKGNKPVLACWLGDRQVAAGRERLSAAGIPCFETPEDSIEAYSYLAGYQRHQQLLTQVPEPRDTQHPADVEGAELIIDGVLAEGRKVLSELESKALLRAFNIPIVPAFPASDSEEALAVAQTIGFPVAMKINSPDITHKSDVRGVHLNIQRAGQVRACFNDLMERIGAANPEARIDGVVLEAMHLPAHGRELHVGVVRDPAFGPVVSFGAGGVAVEILRDRSVSLPPLNSYLARRMIEGTRISGMLQAFRDKPSIDFQALETTLIRVADMACELPRLVELDINPLVADEHGAIALDARIVVDQQPGIARPYGHLAIHPYPRQWVRVKQLPDGTEITLRPIRPEDAAIEQDFVRRLSPQSKYFRFMQAIRELTPVMLVRFTQIDYDREMALIACVPEADTEIEVGVARYVGSPDRESCEFALVVADDWQSRGIGTKLMRQLIEIAKENRFRWMHGEVLRANRPMQNLVGKLGFRLKAHAEDQEILVASLPLDA